MNTFEKIILALQKKMTFPPSYGWFHLMCIGLMVLTIVCLYFRSKKHSEVQLKWILGIYGVVALILEVTKQLIWSFDVDSYTQVVTWEYPWYAAPFQLCTTPIFVTLICLCLKKCKVRDAMLSYMAYITILGSIVVLFIPDNCFAREIVVNVHTMWLHLGSLAVSVYLLMSGEVKVRIKSWMQSVYVFLVFVCIASGLNIYVYHADVLKEIDTFNMFYISPYFISTMPVFGDVQRAVPYPVYLLIYIVALSLGGMAVLGVAALIRKVSRWIKNKKKL